MTAVWTAMSLQRRDDPSNGLSRSLGSLMLPGKPEEHTTVVLHTNMTAHPDLHAQWSAEAQHADSADLTTASGRRASLPTPKFQKLHTNSSSSIMFLGKRINREYQTTFLLPDKQQVAVRRNEVFMPEEAFSEVTLSLAVAAQPEKRAIDGRREAHMDRIIDYLDQSSWRAALLCSSESRDAELLGYLNSAYTSSPARRTRTERSESQQRRYEVVTAREIYSDEEEEEQPPMYTDEEQLTTTGPETLHTSEEPRAVSPPHTVSPEPIIPPRESKHLGTSITRSERLTSSPVFVYSEARGERIRPVSTAETKQKFDELRRQWNERAIRRQSQIDRLKERSGSAARSSPLIPRNGHRGSIVTSILPISDTCLGLTIPVRSVSSPDNVQSPLGLESSQRNSHLSASIPSNVARPYEDQYAMVLSPTLSEPATERSEKDTRFVYRQTRLTIGSDRSGPKSLGDSGASSTSTAHLRSKSTPEIEHFPSLRYPIDSGQSSPLDVTFSSNYYEKYESREYTERIRSCLSPSVPQPVDQPWKRRHDFKLSSAERSEHWLQRPPLNRSCPEYLASDSAETISRPLYVRSSPLRSTKDDAGVTTSKPLTRERKLADKLQDSYDTSIQSPETERQEEHRFKAEEQTFMHLTHFDSIVKYPSWQGHRDHHVRQDTETPELRPFYRRGKASSVPVDTFFAPEPYKIRHRDVEASHVKEMPEVPSVGITEHLSISSERVQRSVSVNDTEKVRKPRVMRRKSDLDQYIEEQIDRVYREELARRESQTLFQKAKEIEGGSSSDLSVLASREERRRPLDNEMQKRVFKKLSKEASDERKQPEHDRLTAPRSPMSMENQRWPPAVPVRRESLWKVSPKRSKEGTEFRSQVDEFQTPFKKPEAPEKISESPGVASTIGVYHTPRRITEKTPELGSVVGQATDHPKEQTPRQEQQDVRTGEVREARESSYKTLQDQQKQPDSQKYIVGKHPSHEYDNKKHRQPQFADQTNLESPSKDTFRLEREKSMEDTLVKVPRPAADEEEKRPESTTGDYSETKKSRLLSIDKLREDPRITEHKAVPEVAKRIHLQRWMPKPTERHSVDEEVTVNRPHLKTADQTGSRIRPQELAVEVQHPIDGGLEDKVRTPWVGRDRIKAQPLQRHVLRETQLDQDDRLSRVNVRKPDGKATEGTTERLERRNIEKRDSDQKLRAKEDKPLKTPLDKPLGATHQGRWSSHAGERPQSRHIESQPASFHQFRQDPLSLAPEQSAEEENHSGYRALAAACLRPLQEIVCPTKIERSDVTGKKDSKSVAKDDRRTDDRHGSHRDSISAKVRKMGEYDQRKSMTLPLVGSVGHMTDTPMERKRGAVSKQSHADRERTRSFDMPRRDSVFQQEGGKNVPISQFDHFGHRRHVDNGKDSDKERTVSRPISTGPCPKDKEQKRVVKLRREPSSDSSAPRRDHLRSSASQKTSTAKGAPDDERHQRTSPPMDDSPPGHVTSLQKSSDVRKDKHGEGTCSMSSASPYGLSRPTPAKRDGSSRRTTQQADRLEQPTRTQAVGHKRHPPPPTSPPYSRPQGLVPEHPNENGQPWYPVNGSDEKPLLTDHSAELTSLKPLGHKRHPPPPTSPPYQRPHRTAPERMIGNGLSQPTVNGTGDSVLYPTQRGPQDDDRLRFQFERRDSVGTPDHIVQGNLDATIPSGDPDEYNLVDEAARKWHSSEYGDTPPHEHAGTTLGSSRTLPKVPRRPSKMNDEASENAGEAGHRLHPSQHHAVPRSREALSEAPTTKQEKHESRPKDRRRRGEVMLPTDTATHVPDEQASMEDARHRDRKMRNGEDSDSHKHRGSYDRPPSSRIEKHDSVSDKGSAHGHRRRHPPPPTASDRTQHPARNGHQDDRRSSGRRPQTVIHDEDDEYVNWPAFRRPNGEEEVEDYGQWPHELSDRSNERSTYDPRVTVDEPVQPPAKNVPKHRRAENGLRTDHRSRKSPPTLEPQPAVRHHPREPGRRGTGEEKDETYEDDDEDLGDSHDDDEELRPPPLRSIPQSKQSSDSLAHQPATPTPPVQLRHPRRGSLLSPGALSLPEYSTPGGISGRSHGGSRGNYRPEQVHPPKVADHERISRPRHKHDTVTSDRRGVSGSKHSLIISTKRRTLSGVTGVNPFYSRSNSMNALWFGDHPVPTSGTVSPVAPLRLSTIQLQAQAELERRHHSASRAQSLDRRSAYSAGGTESRWSRALTETEGYEGVGYGYDTRGRLIHGGADLHQRTVNRRRRLRDGHESLSRVWIPEPDMSPNTQRTADASPSGAARLNERKAQLNDSAFAFALHDFTAPAVR